MDADDADEPLDDVESLELLNEDCDEDDEDSDWLVELEPDDELDTDADESLDESLVLLLRSLWLDDDDGLELLPLDADDPLEDVESEDDECDESDDDDDDRLRLLELVFDVLLDWLLDDVESLDDDDW